MKMGLKGKKKHYYSFSENLIQILTKIGWIKKGAEAKVTQVCTFTIAMKLYTPCAVPSLLVPKIDGSHRIVY